MHFCDICNFQTSLSHNIKKHYNSQKHINNTICNSIMKSDEHLNNNNIKNNIELICVNCKKEYKFLSGLKKHQLICNQKENDSLLNEKINKLKKDFKHKLEIEKLKSEYEHKLEIETLKLKNEYELKLKNQECENLKQITNTNSNNNNKITNNITNINMPKLDFLNSNFCNVLNIDDFIDNYKNKYCLSKTETQILLENSLMGGLNNCISTLSCYLQRIAHKMYTELKCENLTVNESIMPIVLVDGSLRSHYEKNETQWIRTTSMDKLASIYNITNDQIYKHHSKYLAYDAYQKKKIQTGILKANNYTRLNNLQNDFYKKKSITNQNANKDDKNNNEENIENIENTEDTKENKNSISNNEETNEETNDEFEEESDYGYYGYYDSSDDSDYCHNENNDDD